MIAYTFKERLEFHANAMRALEGLEHEVLVTQQIVSRCIGNGGRVLACGNGGSAAEAQHFATELCGRYRSNRTALPGISLNSDGTALTCIGNDFGWDEVFARQVDAFGRPGDVLLAISTSGNSRNVVVAAERANLIGMTTIGLLGKDGGTLSGIVSHPLVINSSDTGAIQEAHLVLIHLLCEPLEVVS